METVKLNKFSINQAIFFLNNNGVIIFPTDTVYGFLVLAEDKKAINKIYKIKNRTKEKLLPIFIKNIKMAKELAEISDKQFKILKKYWPGKYTFILNKKNNKETIALRIPNYKPLNSLLNKINKPLAQTSVNVSGQEPLIKFSEIENQFKNYKILFINAGDLKKSKPSKILDLTQKNIKILRK